MPSMTIHHRGRIFILALLLLTGSKLFGQLSAGFSASSLSGCAPLVVHFTDTSKGTPTKWRWELGNGAVSSLKNPSSTYFNPGTYKIKLIIQNGTDTDTVEKEEYITVYPSPVVAFKVSDSSGCFPLQAQFTDLTTTSGGTISSRIWDFGDGTVTEATHPLHVYTAKGNFAVTLRVTNSFGCTKTITRQQYIKVSNGVKAGFTHVAPGQCKVPVTISFKNASSGPDALRYTWDFGDGAQSAEANPIHTYTKAGTYTVSLVAVSAQGCRDTIKKMNLISIGKVQSDFALPKFCDDKAALISNTTSPTPGSVLWSFGDGTTSTEINPTKSYNKSGVYTIKLVNNFGSCSDSISKQVTVYARTRPAFYAEATNFCSVPAAVNFKNTTTGNNTYKWDFGDGSSSTEKQPAHSYKAAGSYTVRLVVFNENGCSDTLIRRTYIQVKRPVVTLTGLPRTGCNPLTITPSATIVSDHAVAGYLWNFGDGNTSTEAAPGYTYTKAGNYSVSLTITTVNGCTETVAMNNAVRVGDKPEANFAADRFEVCAVNSVHFTDKTTGNADEWFWNFGDSRFDSVQNPSHVFNGLGKFTVTLITKSNTCADTVVIKDIVNVKPPLALFSVMNTCTNKFTKTFKNGSVGATRYEWDFGDGKTSVEKDPVHTYAKKGTYKVVLKVYNDECWNINWTMVKVIDEKAEFTIDQQAACKGSQFRFSATGSDISTYAWNFGDGTSARRSTVFHAYSKPGTYAVSLTTKDALGCTATQTRQVKVFGPVADFKPVSANVCLSDGTVTFNDLSKSDGTNAVEKRVWSFGDGSSDSANTSSFEHKYTAVGNYAVKLRVTDAFGCIDSITKASAVLIAQPRAKFYSPDTLSCTGKPIAFINQSSGSDLRYEWNFGDSKSSEIKSPSHQYEQVGVYSVGLKVTDQYGCTDMVTKEKYINISMPQARFSVSDSVGTCPPLLVRFTNAATQYTSLEWDFGNGNTSTLENPSHYYTTAGVFYAKLLVTGPGGCADSITKKIEIRGPRGSLSYEPLSGCQPVKVKFTAVTERRSSFVWDFSDGTIINSEDSIISHVYDEPGKFVPKMILTDVNGCSVPIQGKDTIRVAAIRAAFSTDKKTLCNEGVIQFTNATVSNDVITKYEWLFGDGTADSQQHPAHTYTKPGLYAAKLIATTQTGCTDTALAATQLTVFEGPVIHISGDTEACTPAKLLFKGHVLRGNEASLKWNWNFGNGQTATSQNPAEQVFANAADYQLSAMATDINGCTYSMKKKIVIHPLPVTNAGQDALVCRGNTLRFSASGAATYVWKAAPELSCTDCPNPVATPAETKTYTVTGYTAFGCSATDSVVLTVRQPFNLSVSKGDTICEGKTTFVWASGADKYSWSPASGLDKTDIARPRANPTQTTAYTVIAKDNDHCFEEKKTVVVKVNPLPSIEAGVDITLPIGNSVALKTIHSNDITQWQWTPGTGLSCTTCPEPKAGPKQTTKYHVQVKTDGGCVNTDDLTVSVICNNGNLFIPNTFSPNGDGSNDKFYPRGTGIALVRSLRIFNRWGELVFERINFNANDASAGWDGTYKGQKLAPDVYVYSCEVVCMNNEVLPFSGDITLLR